MNDRIYERVTAEITNALLRGVVPWRKPWTGADFLPINACSRKPYRGVNVFLLTLAPYADHRWVTFQQARELGGSVSRGERATPVVFWKPWNVEGTDQETGEVLTWNVPLLKQYHVFNVLQCQGLDLPPLRATELATNERLDRAEELIRNIPDPPRYQEHGSSAWYRPSDDLVQVPPISQFETADAYYATRFHEYAHATGHPGRLDRPSVNGEVQFGSTSYGREELIAELCSAFLCAVIGLDNSLLENAASYVQSWLSALRSDKRAIVVAASRAQVAADYLRGIHSKDRI